MTWIENLMIVFGISLEVFAIMECKGSMVAKIDRVQLSLIGIIFSIMQFAMLGVGYAFSKVLMQWVTSADEMVLGRMIAIAIFLMLGIRLFVKAIKNERIHERLEKTMEVKKYLLLLFVIGGYTVGAGIAAGLCESNFLNLVLTLIVVTFAAAIMGMYTGYRAGFEQKTKAYVAGGILLFVAGIDMSIRCFLL